MGSSAPTVIVVGAGVVGAACAEALAQGGARVTVVESEFAGAGATGAAMGHLVVMDDSEAQFALSAGSRRMWTERAAQLPAACEDDACGTLWLAADDQEMALVRAKARFYEERGERVDVLDARALRDAEPSLRAGLVGALCVPADRAVYPPAAARFFLDEARRHGATVCEGTGACAVEPRRVSCGATWLEADAVVVAAGARTPDLVAGLPIVPRKGHLVITDRYPCLVRHQLVELGYLRNAHSLGGASVAFNVQPRRTGQILVGSSRELVGWNAEINRPLCARMLRRACEHIPALATARALRSWVGFRPATPDHLPLVGRWEDGLYIAAGHEGLGITTAPGTARLVADLVLGRPPWLDPKPFDPRRQSPVHE